MNQARWILVMDDREVVRKALLEILQWLDYEAEAVAIGEEALATFDEAQYALLKATVPLAAGDHADGGRGGGRKGSARSGGW